MTMIKVYFKIMIKILIIMIKILIVMNKITIQISLYKNKMIIKF